MLPLPRPPEGPGFFCALFFLPASADKNKTLEFKGPVLPSVSVILRALGLELEHDGHINGLVHVVVLAIDPNPASAIAPYDQLVEQELDDIDRGHLGQGSAHGVPFAIGEVDVEKLELHLSLPIVIEFLVKMPCQGLFIFRLSTWIPELPEPGLVLFQVRKQVGGPIVRGNR
jgi:hypothetical protein